MATKNADKTVSVLAALTALPAEHQRFALWMADVLPSLADQSEMPEVEVRNLIYRVLQAGLLQERRAPSARLDLAKTLGPSLADVDPIPYATVQQARRLAGLRASLLRQGAWSTAAIADARGITPNNARQWISRNRKAHRIFTVTHEGETLVPAFLLDDWLEPRPEAQEPIRLLREAGEDGWALWAWFATPSPWVGGRVPAELLTTAPALVAQSARQRSESAA
ncbi:MAG: hypothetical protein ABI862_18215 [Ilumatobacteraceae bacterium]